MTPSFKDVLKTKRKEKSLTQTEVADKLGLSLKQYQNYEYKDAIPPLDRLNRLREILDYDFTKLIYQTELGETAEKEKVIDVENVSDTTLSELIESNKILAHAHDKLAEANNMLAETNMNLVRMVTVSAPEEIPAAVDRKLGDVLLILAEVASGKRWKSSDDAMKVFHKLLFDTRSKSEADRKKIVQDNSRK